MKNYQECKTCINATRESQKLTTNCGTCSKTDGLNYEIDPFLKVKELDEQIKVLVSEKAKYEEICNIILRFGYLANIKRS